MTSGRSLSLKNVLVLLCAYTLSLSAADTRFAQQPSNVTVVEGHPIFLTCALSDNGSIQWTFNSVTILSSDTRFVITTNVTHSELRIARADHIQHSGYYHCVDYNDISTSAQVVVQYLGVRIGIDPPGANTVDEGGNVKFFCTPPDGVPSPFVRWEFGGIVVAQNQHVSLSLDNTILQLNALTLEQSGIYYCIVENGLGNSVNVSTELRVRYTDGTYKIQIPFEQYCAKAGSGLSIDCLIHPQPKLEMVQWLHEGRPLTSGTQGYYLRQNFTLKINYMTEQHEGKYCCVIVTSIFQRCTEVIMNCQRRLQVSVVPPHYMPNVPLLLNLFHNGLMPMKDLMPSVTWSKHGVPVVNDRRISILPNGSLLIWPVYFRLDIGYYNVSFSHISGIDLTASVALPAIEMPLLRLLISSPVIQLQSSVTLTCSFTSSSYHGFTYTWFLNNSTSPLSSDRTHTISTTALNSTLCITLVGSEDAGTYSCIVLEANISASANLSLSSNLYLLPLTLNQQPTHVCNGSRLTLECPFGGGRDKIHVSWSLNNKPVSGKLEQGGRIFVVSSSQPQHEGTYACNVTDGFTTFYQTLPVTVIVPGVIESVHSVHEAIEGSVVRFDCITSGMPPPHVIWLQGGVPVGELNDTSLVKLPNGSLLISPVTSKDENTYYCAIQVCYNLDIKQFSFKVISRADSSSSSSDSSFRMIEVTILSVGLSVSGLMLAAAICIFVGISCCCYRDHMRNRRTNIVRQRAQLAGALRRQASMRASGRKDNGSVLASSVLGQEMSTFTASRPKVLSEATAPPQPLPATPTPTPTPASNSIAISINSISSEVDSALSNFPRTNLQLREVMGEGEFGPVVLGWAEILPLEKSEVAVKVLLPHNTSASHFQPKAVLSDFASQMQLQHSNICGILGLCTDAEPYYVIYEYLDKGDLKRFLLEGKDGHSIALKDLCSIVAQVSEGMAFLYSQRIIHGDLATRNCIISSQLKVKIADLGIGHDLYKNDYFDNGSQLLPIRWMAPELLAVSSSVGPEFSLYSDIWAFGVFCWEVFTYASQPYEGLTDLEVLDQVPKGHTLTPLAKMCPSLFHSIMQTCWSYKLDERPKFSTLSAAIGKDNWQTFP